MNSIKSNTIHKGILFCMEIPHTKSAEIFFTELEIILRKMLDKYKSVCYNDYSK
jgi:hypothetical protein